MPIRIGLLFLLSLFTIPCQGQEIHFTHYSVKDGLPSSQVYDIVQDNFGYIWFSTDRGICRYDGSSFESFASIEGMTSNIVFDLVKQDDGTIWCSTINHSLFSISGEKPKFTPYAYNRALKNIGSPALITTNFHRTKANEIYMSFVNGSGYVYIDGAGNVQNNAELQVTGTKHHHSIVINDSDQSFFYSMVQSGAEIGSWSKRIQNKKNHNAAEYIKATYIPKKKASIFSSFKLVEIQYPDGHRKELPQSHDPIGLGIYGEDNFWVGLRNGGLRIYNCDGRLLHHLLNGKSVTSCFQDHEGGLWISTTEEGVYYIKSLEVSSYDLNSNWVQQLTADPNGNLWVAMYNGDVRTIKNNLVSNIYNSNTGKPSLVYFDEVQNQIYYASDCNIYNQNNSIKHSFGYYPRYITRSFQSNLIFGAHHSVGTFSDTYTQLLRFDQKLHDLILYKKELIIACESKLFNYNGENLKDISHYLPSNLHFKSLAKTNSHLLIGTENGGFFLYANGKYRQFSKAEGLSSNTISNIFVENDSTFWLSTNSGANRIVLSKTDFQIDVINTTHGLISDEITDVQIIGNTVWVATRSGLNSFNKSLVEKHEANTWKNFLRFTGIKINDKRQIISSEYDLPYYQNRIELNFKAVSFKNKAGLMFRYRLKGLESKWTYGNGNRITYSSLPSGRYIFIAQTKNTEGNWVNQEIKMVFVIHPPYWKTWWFLSSLIVGIVILIYLFFKYRILSYNKDISRELLRQLLKKIRKKQLYVIYRDQGKDVRIPSDQIGYVQSSRNYLEIHTKSEKYVVRGKIGEFKDCVPDPLEYVRIHRSYIVRLDQIEKKGANEIIVLGKTITVSKKYLGALDNIHF
ncbi:MAG: ligand-binding sensor domain-containing protein [Crocinitomicaceae bacterium]|jgi:ligand-binding sensor domain-containing protein